MWRAFRLSAGTTLNSTLHGPPGNPAELKGFLHANCGLGLIIALLETVFHLCMRLGKLLLHIRTENDEFPHCRV